MNGCNCISDIKDKLKNYYENKDNVENVEHIAFKNIAFMFDTGLTQLYSEIEVEYNYLNRKKELKHKKEKANMNYTYCPFCGKKYKRDNESEEN